MDFFIIFQFDKIIAVRESLPCATPFEACYGTLPRAFLIPRARQMLSLCRRMGFSCLLLAEGEERFVKEALFSAGACCFFDKIYISGETPVSLPDLTPEYCFYPVCENLSEPWGALCSGFAVPRRSGFTPLPAPFV